MIGTAQRGAAKCGCKAGVFERAPGESAGIDPQRSAHR